MPAILTNEVRRKQVLLSTKQLIVTVEVKATEIQAWHDDVLSIEELSIY